MTPTDGAGGLSPFHLAIPVHDLTVARAFYGTLFGCPEGRSAAEWVDFDFFGHQLVAHLDPSRRALVAPVHTPMHTNEVDGHQVPVPHFGIVLAWERWHELVERLRAAGIRFVIEPGIRFAGAAGEQATFFLYDPSGNALEFKAFRDPARLFAR
jgi:extradiol dioxygenase family protein